MHSWSRAPARGVSSPPRRRGLLPWLATLWLITLWLITLWLVAGSLPAQGLKENLDLPYDSLAEANEEEDAPEVVFFYGLVLEGDGFFYTVDKSGSMGQGELPIAKREISRNISEFSERTQFAVNFFASEVDKFPPDQLPVEATPQQKQAALAFISGIQVGGGSCCQKGLLEALRYANVCSAKRKVIIYVGDGGGTCRSSGLDEASYQAQTLQLVQTQNYQRVIINTVGVLMHTQQPFHEQFLKTLAQQNGGTYRRIN
jgi:hypothetical protein